MNAKKYLREQAEKDQQKVLSADNGEFFHSLQDKMENKSKKKNHLITWIVSTATVLTSIIVIVCVLIFYNPTETPIVYLEENFNTYDSTIEELNNDIQNFSIEIDNSIYSSKILKTVDTISGDTLYYIVGINSLDTLINFEIVIVCNKNYQYKDFNKTNEFINLALPNYAISYLTTLTQDPDFGINKLSGMAEINLDNEYVYITKYSEFMLDAEGSFLKIIQQIIK